MAEEWSRVLTKRLTVAAFWLRNDTSCRACYNPRWHILCFIPSE